MSTHAYGTLLLALAALQLGCGSAAVSGAPVCPPIAERQASGDSSPRAEAESRDAAAESCFAVSVEVGASELRVVTRAAPAAAWLSASPSIRDFAAQDARGALQVRVEGERYTFDRAVEGTLELRYRLVEDAGAAEEVVLGELARFDGRALLLPEGDSPCLLRVEVSGVPSEEVATTLGLGARHELIARPLDLRDVTWAFGTLEHARFEAREGRDVVVSIGPRRYDLRWVGAEIALLRSRVDAYFGGMDAENHTTLLLSVPVGAGTPAFAVARSGIGLRALVRQDTEWNAEARLALAQVLVRRWLGGVLRFVDADGNDEAWASFGLTRWIAQELLSGMGTLSALERAADLTRLEAAIALESPEPAPAMARGALLAAALDASLRARSSSLRALVLDLLARAEDRQGAPLPRAEFVEALAVVTSEAFASRFEAQVLGREALQVPPGAFGPCLRRASARHRRFALGIDVAAQDDALRVTRVDEAHPAYAAGLREGQLARDLRYTQGEPSTLARLTLVADERELTWLPFDREVRGPAWQRVPRVPEERCVER